MICLFSDKSKMVLEEKDVGPTMHNLPQFASKISSTYFKFFLEQSDAQNQAKEEANIRRKNRLSKSQNKQE